MRLLVTFTFDISLTLWHDRGLLERELLIYKMMLKDGHRVGLLTYGNDEDLRYKEYTKGIDIFPVYSRMGRPRNKFFRLLATFLIPFRMASVFKDHDIYKTNQMLGSWVPVVAKFLYGKKLVVRCGYEWLRTALSESRGFKKFYTAVLGFFVELAAYVTSDRIIVTTPVISKFVQKRFKQPKDKIVCIPNFIDTGNFRKLESDTYSDRILYVGRLNSRKNLMSLLEAIRTTEGGPKTILDMIGAGDYLEEMKKVALGNNIDINFIGSIANDRLPVYINKYPVFVLVSYFENNPKVLLEAMACERVVVATNVEGIKELVTDNISGILVSTGAAGIRKGLERAFGLTDEERAAMGRRARDIVEKVSSLTKVFKKEMGVYRKLKS